MKKTIIILLACLVLVGSFAGGIIIGVVGSQAAGAQDNEILVSQQQYDELLKYQKLETTQQMIEQMYYSDYDESLFVDYAIKGLVASLGDPYSYYYTQEEYEARLAEDEGNYVGIGVQVTLDDASLCTVTTVFQDSPALKGGVLPGDRIIAVDGIDVRGMILDDVVARIKGEEGTQVEVIVMRGTETLALPLERAQVLANHVNYRMIDDQVGYIEITGFTGDDVEGFMEAVAFLESNQAKALVLDLRNNGGGLVDDASRIADVLLPQGNIFTLVDKNGNVTYSGDSDMKCLGLPLAVLVNEYSASASEILAGAIQDHEAGVLVGTQTFGKGIVQTPLAFADGSVLMITTEYYLTPDGRKIHGEGLSPDIESELNEEAHIYLMTDEEDNQLQDALRYLKGQIAE